MTFSGSPHDSIGDALPYLDRATKKPESADEARQAAIENACRIALTHRIAMLSAVRKISIAGFLFFLFLAIITSNWLLIPISIGAGLLTGFTMSWYSMEHVRRLTGMSYRTQMMTWQLYKLSIAEWRQ
jgi:hypothetical protein